MSTTWATPAAGWPKGSAAGPLCSPCAYGNCSRPSRGDSLFCGGHDLAIERPKHHGNPFRDALGRFSHAR